jgi:hypothetical protein
MPAASLRDLWIAWSLCALPRLAAVVAVWPNVALSTSSVTIEAGQLASDLATPIWPPGYPAFAEVLWRVVGGHLFAYAAGHVAISALVGVFVLDLCRSLGLERRVAWIAVVAAACLPYYVSTSVRQIDVSIVIAVCAGSVAAMARWRASASPRVVGLVVTAGAAMVLFLMRANALSMIVAVYALIFVCPGPLRRSHVVASVAAFGVLLLLWSVANERRFGAFTPMPANVGMNLWIGNRPGAGAELMARDFNPTLVPALDVPGETIYEFDRAAERAAWDYIGTHPAETLANAGRKMVRYFDWRLDEQRPHSRAEGWAYTLPYLVMTALAAWGTLVLWRKNRWALAVLMTVIVGYLLPHLLAFSMIRFRMSVEWATLILAAVGVDALARAAFATYPLRRHE